MTGITVISNETKLFTHDFDVIQAFQSDFCVINFVQLLIVVMIIKGCESCCKPVEALYLPDYS